jgi:hypothetical protein
MTTCGLSSLARLRLSTIVPTVAIAIGYGCVGTDQPRNEEIARLCAAAWTEKFEQSPARGYFRFDPVRATGVRRISPTEIEALAQNNLVYMRALQPFDPIYVLGNARGAGLTPGPRGTRIQSEEKCRLVKYDSGWRAYPAD